MKNSFYGTKYKKIVRHLVVLIMNFHNKTHKKKMNQISKVNSKVIK